MPLIPLNLTKIEISFPFEDKEKTLCVWSYSKNIYNNRLLSQEGREYITNRMREVIEEALCAGKRYFFCFRPNRFELTALDIVNSFRKEYPEIRTALFFLQTDFINSYKDRTENELYFFCHTNGRDIHREYYELVCHHVREIITILSPERVERCPLVKLAAESGVSFINMYDGYVRLIAASGYTKHAAPPEGVAALLREKGYSSLNEIRQALLKDMKATFSSEAFKKVLLLEKLHDRMDAELLHSHTTNEIRAGKTRMDTIY